MTNQIRHNQQPNKENECSLKNSHKKYFRSYKFKRPMKKDCIKAYRTQEVERSCVETLETWDSQQMPLRQGGYQEFWDTLVTAVKNKTVTFCSLKFLSFFGIIFIQLLSTFIFFYLLAQHKVQSIMILCLFILIYWIIFV